MIPIQFTCAHCERQVPFMDAGLYHYEHRDHCPACNVSRHIMFGTASTEPCDGLMHPVAVTTTAPPLIILECAICRYRWVTYEEDHWATLPPDRQTALINQAYEQTEWQNRKPTVIYIPRREYRTQPPVIPDEDLGTRPRVARRP